MDIAALAKQAAAAAPMPTLRAATPMPGVVAHVDGDYCAYFCAGNDDTDAGTARRNLLHRLDKIKFLTGATSTVVHLTDRASKKGLRYAAATIKPYQGQRSSGRKPKNWEILREYMEGYEGDKYRTKNWTEREADDGIAYVAHAAASHGKLAVIATADKDMRMLAGRHINWQTNHIIDVPNGCFDLVGGDGLQYGHKWFWLQMLMGDTADNIPGLPKFIKPNGKEGLMGKATASAQLKDTTSNDEAFHIVSGLYGGWYEDEAMDRLVEQACLLWLRTDRYAEIDDYLTIIPNTQRVLDATERMRRRIKDTVAELSELGYA